MAEGKSHDTPTAANRQEDSAFDGLPAEPRAHFSDANLIEIVRRYILHGSLPTQGPISGSLTWVSSAHALGALAELEKRHA